MRRAASLLVLVLLICRLAGAETAFEAADVHPSPQGTTEYSAFLPNGRVEFYGATLLHLIATAWNVRADRVVDGPAWLDTDKFDVIAQAPAPASQQELRVKLQVLLGERFHLQVHNTERPLPVYALVRGNGPAKDHAGTGDSGCRRSRGEGMSVYACRNTTIANLAAALPRLARDYFDQPVVDRSGLEGGYDFRLRWASRAQMQPGDGGSLYRSLEKELGLKVERSTEPMPVIAVVGTDREPTGNAADATERLGAPPTEFEVADVHLSRPDEESDDSSTNGRYEIRAYSLRELIEFAYDAESDRVIGGERWLDTERFDIVAKTVPTASIDAIRVMMQALLADRFGLKVHEENRLVSVYALGAKKPKLEEADAKELDTCRMGYADGERLFECRNTTMEQFTEKLRDATDGYIDHPIVDRTGLEGAYDFTLSWSPRTQQTVSRRIRGGGPGSAASAAAPLGVVPQAADRPAGLTIFEAVERELGLRLTAAKSSMDVVVIDHVERTPADN